MAKWCLMSPNLLIWKVFLTIPYLIHTSYPLLEFLLIISECSNKEPVLPYIGQNWHDVKIDGMCTPCTLYSLSVLIFYVLICIIFKKKEMYFCFIWQNYPTGIPKKHLPNIKIQEQTASLLHFHITPTIENIYDIPCKEMVSFK